MLDILHPQSLHRPHAPTHLQVTGRPLDTSKDYYPVESESLDHWRRRRRPASPAGNQATSDADNIAKERSHTKVDSASSDMSGTFPGHAGAQFSNGHSSSRPATKMNSYQVAHKADFSHSSRPVLPYAVQTSSQHSSRPATPIFQQVPHYGQSQDSSIASYLRIPSTIKNGNGSLAEFAAQITCLFWFEPANLIMSIARSDASPVPTSRLSQETIPATGFLKWVTTILSTTQVNQNVILLALLFIYRLKIQNPTVKGKLGSEFRLLTVALMLGNKFLDDNTYTNKTWAEVSGISVHEIHVMEVEFLGNIRYNLFVSADAWELWHKQLGLFWTYFDRASRMPPEQAQKVFPTRLSALQIPHALPSPPASNSASPPYAYSSSPNIPSQLTPSSLPSQHLPDSQSSAGLSSHHDSQLAGRKRSYDDNMQAPQPKRHLGNGMNFPLLSTSTFPQFPSSSQIPSLSTVPTPQLPPQFHQQAPEYSQQRTPTSSQPPVNWLQAVHSLETPNPLDRSQTFHERSSRNNTPTSTTARSIGANAFPSIAAHSTLPRSLSPSYLLGQRSSPFKPVHHVDQLALPPQHTSTVQDAPANMSHDQMFWQPLSKQISEPRQGRVPYLHRDAWPATHQSSQWPDYATAPTILHQA